MISRTLLIVSLCLITSLLSSQEVTKAFLKNGNIYLQYDNADSRQITFKGIDSQATLSNDKKFVVFKRTIKNANEPEEGEEVIEDTKIIKYDFSTSVEKVLVQGCRSDGTGSSIISYADSDEYPFSGLCNITNVQLSPDGQRVYFETSAWTVSHAIHYCYIPTAKIAFFSAGTLISIQANGNLSISITGIEQNKGRYTQTWLYDKSGLPIEAIGEKLF